MTAFNTIVGYINQSYNTNAKIVAIPNNRSQDQIVDGQCFIPCPSGCRAGPAWAWSDGSASPGSKLHERTPGRLRLRLHTCS